MMAQMSLVSLGVKVVSVAPGVEDLVVSSMVAVIVTAMVLGFLCGSIAFGVVESCCRCVKWKF